MTPASAHTTIGDGDWSIFMRNSPWLAASEGEELGADPESRELADKVEVGASSAIADQLWDNDQHSLTFWHLFLRGHLRGEQPSGLSAASVRLAGQRWV